MRAVILAAGMGVRLGGGVHKALATVAPGVTLLSNQLQLLAPVVGRAGTFIVVGHAARGIRRAAPGARFVENPRYAETNTAKSLLAALQVVDDDVLLVNGDLYFEEAALRRMLMPPVRSARTLVRPGVSDGESVVYTLESGGTIASIGKGIASGAGEALGMSLIPKRDRRELIDALEAASDGAYYEDAFSTCLRGGKWLLEPVDAGDAFCREVDFPADLESVRRTLERRATARASEAPAIESKAPTWRAGRIGLYGVGHFGYALLRRLEEKALAGARGRVSLRAYDRDEAVRRTLRDERRHPYYDSGTPMATEVEIAGSVDELLDGLDTLVLAVMSSATREVARAMAQRGWKGRLAIVNTAKALDAETGRRLSEVVREELSPAGLSYVYCALAGGTIANDMLRDEPLGMTVACEDRAVLPGVRALFASPSLWVEASTDLAGVELAGAFKNVVAICAGMAHGMGLSIGAETHLISRMASEVEEFCVACKGADRATFSIGSQAWGSDLWMSCTGATRNRALGELLGRGVSLDEAQARMAAERRTVEGVQTLRAMRALFRDYPGELPLLSRAAAVVLAGAPPATLIDALMMLDAEAHAQ